MQYKHEYGVEVEDLIRKVAKNDERQFLREFLFDLLSPAEYREVAVRWQIIKMLKNGENHREIAKKLKVSVATTMRGSKELSNKKGGFNAAWNKYYK